MAVSVFKRTSSQSLSLKVEEESTFPIFLTWLARQASFLNSKLKKTLLFIILNHLIIKYSLTLMRLRRFASIIALTPASKALSHLTSVHPLVIKIGKLLPVCSKMCIFVVEMAGKALFPVCLRMCKCPNLGPKISTSSVWMRILRVCKEVGKSLFLTLFMQSWHAYATGYEQNCSGQCPHNL